MDERYRLIMESEHIGTAERTDALLDELQEIREKLDATPKWKWLRRMHLNRDLLGYTGALQENERIRARREAQGPGLETAFR